MFCFLARAYYCDCMCVRNRALGWRCVIPESHYVFIMFSRSCVPRESLFECLLYESVHYSVYVPDCLCVFDLLCLVR